MSGENHSSTSGWLTARADNPKTTSAHPHDHHVHEVAFDFQPISKHTLKWGNTSELVEAQPPKTKIFFTLSGSVGATQGSRGAKHVLVQRNNCTSKTKALLVKPNPPLKYTEQTPCMYQRATKKNKHRRRERSRGKQTMPITFRPKTLLRAPPWRVRARSKRALLLLVLRL